MAVSVGTLFLDLRASTEGLRKDSAKAVQYMRRVGNDMAKAIAVGAAGAAAGLAVVIEQASEKIDKLAKSSDALGVPIEKLRALQELGTKAGIGIDEINGAMGSLQKQVFLAAAGSEKAAYGFRALGLNVQEMIKMSPDKQLGMITDALNKIENTTVRAGIASKIFGDDAAKLMAVFKDGSAGIDEADKRLQSLGVSLSRVDAAKVEIANDAISDLKLIAEGAGNQLAVVFAPIIKGVAEWLKSAAGETHGFHDWIVKLVDIGVSGVGLLADAFRGWQLIIKGGQIAIIATMGAFESLRKVGEVAILGLSAILAQAMKGFQELGYVVQIGFFMLMDKVKGVVQSVVNFLLDGLNLIISGINKITKTKIEPIKIDIENIDFQKKINESSKALDDLINTPTDNKIAFDQSLGELKKFIADSKTGTDEYSMAIKRTQNEIGALLDKPLPSVALDNWLANTRAKVQTEAEGIAAAVKPVFDSVQIEPLKPETVEKTKKLANELYDKVFNPWMESYKAIQDQIAGLVRGTVSWKDALVDVAQTFVTTVIQSFVQMGAQWLASQMAMSMGMQAMQQSQMAAATASSAASASTLAATWMPAAIAASIATMGAASMAGVASFTAAMALGTAAAVGIGALGGLATSALGAGSKMSGARARGGHVNAGSLYKVNENGTEYFKPNVSGDVVPMGDMEKHMDPTQSAAVINVSQNFASGLSRQDLQKEAREIERRTIAGLLDGVSRGGVIRKGIRR